MRQSLFDGFYFARITHVLVDLKQTVVIFAWRTLAFSLGISMTLERGVIKKARVCLGAVAPTPILVPAAADTIIGTKLDDAALAALAAACSDACDPIDDKRGTAAYRIRVAGVLARRVATIAFQRAGGAA